MEELPDRRVFRIGRRNVVLNFRRSPDSEFGAYADAFHEAARLLAENLLQRPGYSDLEALPIVFLYRHAVELYLKAIVILGGNLLVVNGEEIDSGELQRMMGSHRLTPLLPHVSRILAAVGMKWSVDEPPEFRSFDDLTQVLREIEEVDANSFAFRYPINRRGEGSVPNNFTFDIATFAVTMDALVELLSAALTGLDATWDDVCDFLSETAQP